MKNWRDPTFNAVHNETADVQHVPRELSVMARESQFLTVEAAHDPELARMYRFGSHTQSARSEDICGQGSVGDDRLASTTATIE